MNNPLQWARRLAPRFRIGRLARPIDDLIAAPTRGELLGAEGLAERAREIARGQRLRAAARPWRVRRHPSRLLARLDETRQLLAASRVRLAAVAAAGLDVSPAGDWLLDNFHVLEEHTRQVRASLPPAYYAELPELAEGELAGYPRVYELAITLIGHSEGRVDHDNVELYVGAFQELAPLTLGELWAIPAMLRLALVESVRRNTLRTVRWLDETADADRWAAQLADAGGGRAAVRRAVDTFAAEHPALTATFVARLLRQLRIADGGEASLVWVEAWLHEEGVHAEDAATRANDRLALTQVMMANGITSLRATRHFDWKAFVERQSVVEAALRTDPDGTYPRMTFATRDHYRHAVERIARHSGMAEREVAALAVAHARAGATDHPENPARAHVGHALVDAGLPALEAACGYRGPVGERVHRAVLRHPELALFGGIAAGTVAAVLIALRLGGVEGAPGTAALLGVLAALLLPASDIAIGVVNQLVTAFLPPRTLPRLDLHDAAGIPAEHRTAVVIPTMFGSVESVDEALDNLEVQFLANREAHLHFAVLSDFTDAPTETRDGDDAIVDAAVAGVRALNARYSEGRDDAFYLFHRPRRWNPREGAWMGWERKRGKLGEFNRFVRGGTRESFSVVEGNLEAIRGVRYAITLDADTVLPPDAAPALVGTLAHPLNRAVWDESRRCVVRGYGILQPRVGVSLPSAHRTRFATIHSGHPGVDPYTTAVSDVYQDLFGEGSFTGKGIYDVALFERATRGRFPENTLLSHDLIEGSYARAGLATDVEVFDDYPARYLTHARRKHRWIRGDWQLLRWLGRRVPGPDGPERNRLSALSRWKLLDNLRRSLVEPAQLALLVAGWTVLPGSPLGWTLLGLLAIAAPWIVALLLATLRPPATESRRAHYAALGQDARESARQVAVAVTFLPHQAWLSMDAIVRTLWRTTVTGRHLLEWQTASQAEQSAAGTAQESWRAMAPAVIVAMVAVALAAWHGATGAPGALLPLAVAVVPLGVLWIAAPAIARALSATTDQAHEPLSPANRTRAERYAAAHWRYFDRFVTAETSWLVPDNFQDDPAPVVAMRTSPTNIGLQLLATLSAVDLGLLPLEEGATRLERAFQSLARMPRLHGHFYNWYDLHDLRVLEPAYVSTVDSGNLAGHLVALRQGCLAYAAEADASLAARLQALADEAGAYSEAMDFGFLFDRDRELFAIGYLAGSPSLDASSYDLLASEARLASFMAVARNQVPMDHWFRLGRTLTHASGSTALVSWSGSMFEYLMPTLVMRSYPRTVLEETERGAVRRQMAHGAAHGVPWGISESAYNLRDRHFTYQYRAFGVPDLALKRGLGQDLVVAPYASMLALPVLPEEALENLAALERMGALGEYGFHDALDFTRPDGDARFALVHNWMAHHVGMSLVALTNVLAGDPWTRRFHADPLVRAAELLLQERTPRRLAIQPPQPAEDPRAVAAPVRDRPTVREYASPATPEPRVALLGHLPYTVMVTNCGAGYSNHEGLAVTRWRADATTDDTGQFCYVKDLATGRVWSAAHQPVCAPADRFLAQLATDRVQFHRADGEVTTHTEIAVLPADAAEVRRVTVTNEGPEVREVELTSYAELVLAPPDTDRAHPAFANLFVETEWHEWCGAIFATRRPRSATERAVWAVHVAAVDGELVGPVTCETDRARVVGRGRTLRAPAALDDEADGPLAGTTGAVLDPVAVLRVRLRLAPGASGTVAFTTLVAPTRDRAFELADRYDDPSAAQRALDLAWTTAQVELRELDLSSKEAARFQDMAGHLLYGDGVLGATPRERAGERGSQPLLWSLGVSGDRPILLATIDSIDGLPTLRHLLAAHHYLRRRGMPVDLVIVDVLGASYLQDLQQRVMALVSASSEGGMLDQPGGVFVRSAALLAPDALRMLRATARVHVRCDGRSLDRALAPRAEALADAAAEAGPAAPAMPAATGAIERQMTSAPTVERVLRRLSTGLRPRRERGSDGYVSRPTPSSRPAIPALPSAGDAAAPLLCDNGIGGLAADGDYEIRLRPGQPTPAPWINVVANAHGGFFTSERGSGTAWCGSSYFYRLTPWHNDPVSDPASDVLYVRDEDSGALWSATPAPAGSAATFTVRHGAGASTFAHERDGIASHLVMGLAPDAAVKLSILRLENRGTRPRRLTVTAYVEWTLGAQREHTQHHVQATYDAARGVIRARNTFDPLYAGHVAFCAISEPVTGCTSDRRAFLGRNGTRAAPAALAPGATLAGATVAPLDPCAALQCEVLLAPGESRELVVALGAGTDAGEADRLAAQYADVHRARAAVERTRDEWATRLGTIRVQTPEPELDAMVNRWALYQALGCRMWARSALYQSSGAYGFRDQLQDCMAFVHAEPGVAREHILRAAARQFLEGDVQHWWHPQSGRGVRTRFSDDLAWLPFVVEHYVRVSGDATVLDDYVPFLAARPLEPHEHERYDLPEVTEEHGTVYEHCRRALRRACTHGAHGLPLIGIGDWNDGMSRVGIEGRGESVWLAWFLVATLRRFAPIAAARGDAEEAAGFLALADGYAAAVEAHGWDGSWYRRAFFDDGTPLGSADSEECRIDAIAQSWSVISGAGDPERRATAMAAFERDLVREDARLLMLLTPPFDRMPHDPGYIKGYLPGVRENGAQYTHAALWSVLATAMQGDGDRAGALLRMLNPLTHAATPEDAATYKVEPYVIAADVYTAEGQLGRGGWTWYTGSASWFYRVALEAVLGFDRRGDTLRIAPCVPRTWPGYAIDYRFGGTTYRIAVELDAGATGMTASLDGDALADGVIPLVDDGAAHVVTVRAPHAVAATPAALAR